MGIKMNLNSDKQKQIPEEDQAWVEYTEGRRIKVTQVKNVI